MTKLFEDRIFQACRFDKREKFHDRWEKSVRRDTNKSLIKVTSIETLNKTEELLVEMYDFKFYQAHQHPVEQRCIVTFNIAYIYMTLNDFSFVYRLLTFHHI